VRNQFHIFQQDALGCRKARFVKLAFDDCFYRLIGCSLNPQEVGMAVQSIRTPVQIRDVASDHLFVTARKMPFGEMDGVSQFDHATQEVRPRSEALDDAGNSLSPRAGSPEVVGSGGFSGGFSIFDDPDFCGRLGGRSAMCARRILCIVVCIHIVRIDGLLLIQSTNLLLAPDGDDRTASPSRGSRVGYLYMGRLGAPTRAAQKANFRANWIRRGGRDERT
jgi:hypothetical protein